MTLKIKGRAMLDIPDFYDKNRVGEIWQVNYGDRSTDAENWAKKKNIQPAKEDKLKVCLLLIDVQNTFCIPGFEMYVGGNSGLAAVEDNQRICEFIYRNLNKITQITATMDTHTASQIFHPCFLVDENGNHPGAAEIIEQTDIESGKWKVNPAVANSLNEAEGFLEEHLKFYSNELKAKGKFALITWPYHAMLGGIGHALVPAIEEALFFHNICRQSQTRFELKGDHPLTENYSVLSPEVKTGKDGNILGSRNKELIDDLLRFDRVYIAGQAKSHCVSWTIADLITEMKAVDRGLIKKIYLLEDCTSPVVIPGAVDFTDIANKAYEAFAKEGANIVKSMD